MQTRSSDRFPTVRTEGAILPADLLQRVAASDVGLEGMSPESYHLVAGERINEATNRAWNRLLGAWSAFQHGLEKLPPSDPGTSLSRERWLLPLFQELGYGRLPLAKPIELEDKSYHISHAWSHVPIHLVGCRVDLDRRTPGVAGAAHASPHGLVQELLNRSEAHLWGAVSNGLKLRLLRDNIRLTRQAFVEFDVQAMFDGKVYTDFALLWRLCHESRVEAEKPTDCWLERWSKLAQQQGLRVLDQLRDGVEKSIAALGRGFLSCPANQALRDKLRSGNLDAQDYYRQLLRLVYRLLFLFVAEDRDLLFDPKSTELARDRYARFYSSTRLRRQAERLRGTQHTDLYQGLGLVLARLGNGGCPELALPALGSFLFSPDATRDLNGCELANSDLLDTIRALALTNDGQALRPVDYRNLGSEELGSIYESLLELHPILNQEAGTFDLRTASGHERKTTGSYYTPTSLITCLLDSALDPVLDEAAKKPNAEQALLDLKVCDPACGSGHFLIAAAHRIAKRLACIRTGEEEPPPEAVRKGLRDVIGRCVYGVDLNPMAAELCKVALWMDALEPGKPLSFLDHHIQCGNSLLGTTPALIAKGIPDEAFEPIEGDDKTMCRAAKKQNQDDRRGQGDLFDDCQPWNRLGDLAAAMHGLELESDDTLAGVRLKQERYAALVHSTGYLYGHFLADTWCAAFVWRKDRTFDYAITERVLRRIEKNPHDVTPWMRQEIERLAYQYQFFHWHLAFPDVFCPAAKASLGPESGEDTVTGWTGGFDVVLGNPPWERIKLQEQEWFAERQPSIASARNAAERRRMIENLRSEDPALFRAFLDDRRRAEGESHFIRDSRRYPLCGRGDVNTYTLFAETNRHIISDRGRVGCIVPTGIATDDTTKLFFQDLIANHKLHSYYGFKNERFLFPKPVEHVVTFGLLTMLGSSLNSPSAEFCWNAWTVEDMRDPNRRLVLTEQEIAQLNPNTRTCPVFRSRRDAEINKAIYSRVPVLLRDGDPQENPWGIRFTAMFHMANDSGQFQIAEQLTNGGWTINGNVFRKANEEYLPLYEAKMLHHFDHRFSTYVGQTNSQANMNKLPELDDGQHADPDRVVQPRYWVSATTVTENLRERWDRRWLLGWRDICRNTDQRTLIACLLPLAGVGHKAPLIMPQGSAVEVACFYANLCSVILDYISRQKVGGTSMAIYLMKQFAILPPEYYRRSCPWHLEHLLAEWIQTRLLELTYTSWDLQPFALDCGHQGSPFRWDRQRRLLLRCELDAAFFHLYGISRDDTDYIMETFPIVKRKDIEKHGRHLTKETILAIYDAMAEAIRTGQPYQTRLDPPPADPRVAHPPRDQNAPSPVRPTAPTVITRPRNSIDPKRIVEAFTQIRDGMSADYVVACPEANRRFLDRLRELGMDGDATATNMALLNARKAGRLKGMPSKRDYRLPAAMEPWTFASEWAIRHLQRELVREIDRLIALDELLCNPDYAARFDALAARIKPGFKPLEYRWAVLSLRKKGKAKPGPHDLSIDLERQIPLADARKDLPEGAGLYLIRSASQPLYVNHAADLRTQIMRHLEVAADTLVPTWLTDPTGPAVCLSYAYLPSVSSDRLREYRITTIANYRPWLNLLDIEGVA